MAKNKNIANLTPEHLESLLSSYVGKSVKEVLKAANLLVENEKSKQKKTSDKIEDLELRAEQDEEEVQDEQEDTSTEEKESEGSPKIKAQKLPDAMEADDVARMLNIIRAGKSLKDPDVQSRFDIWFGSLTPPEKIALKGFLDGIAQIIAGDVEAEQASKPSAAPYNVEMGAAPKESPRKVDKKLKQSTKKDSPSAGTDTPIVVGETANIPSLKKRMIK